MFELPRCSRCKEVVRLPVSSTAWVRCPHCQSEYPIEQILDQLPPALEAIPTPSPLSASGVEVAPSSQQPVLDGSCSSPVVDINTGTGHTEPANTQQSNPQLVIDEVKAEVRSPENLRAERRKNVARRKSDPSLGFAKVALGGFAGVVIGQLILWWLPLPYRTDPLKIAPKLPSPVKFLAPDSIRDTSLRIPGDQKLEIKSPDELAMNSMNQSAQPGVELTVDDLRKYASANPKNSNDPASRVFRPADATEFSLDELRDALNTARQADRNISAITESGETSLPRDWYTSLTALAEFTTFSNPADPTIKAFHRAARDFLHRVASDEQKQLAICKFANQEWQSAATGRGVLLCGTVREMRQRSHFMETQAQLKDGAGKIEIVQSLTTEVKLPYTVGDKVLVLGILVAEPNRYLEGYEGQAGTVVWSGLAIPTN